MFAQPERAVQLLWLNLVTNGVHDVALAGERPEGDELSRPPRRPYCRQYRLGDVGVGVIGSDDCQ
nr:cation-translocating P-type ATPase C-terminal domain-containing protein [Neorhizobium galegae]